MKKIIFLFSVIASGAIFSCGSTTVTGTYSGKWTTLGLSDDTTDGQVIIKPTGSEVSVQVSSAWFPTVTIDEVSVNAFDPGYYEFQKLGYPGAYIEGNYIAPDLIQISYVDTTYDYFYYFMGYRN